MARILLVQIFMFLIFSLLHVLGLLQPLGVGAWIVQAPFRRGHTTEARTAPVSIAVALSDTGKLLSGAWRSFSAGTDL